MGPARTLGADRVRPGVGRGPPGVVVRGLRTVAGPRLAAAVGHGPTGPAGPGLVAAVDSHPPGPVGLGQSEEESHGRFAASGRPAEVVPARRDPVRPPGILGSGAERSPPLSGPAGSVVRGPVRYRPAPAARRPIWTSRRLRRSVPRVLSGRGRAGVLPGPRGRAAPGAEHRVRRTVPVPGTTRRAWPGARQPIARPDGGTGRRGAGPPGPGPVGRPRPAGRQAAGTSTRGHRPPGPSLPAGRAGTTAAGERRCGSTRR
jgi:hypothetical protein